MHLVDIIFELVLNQTGSKKDAGFFSNLNANKLS